MYTHDKRIVMTLDAGGTNFVFSAIQGGEHIITPLQLPAITDDINLCLEQLVKGFRTVQSSLEERPVAISFAFPGPADYENGVIGDLPNLPAFRGGIALGPYLSMKFNLPVFINNDGNLYAYGEALFGVLPVVNEKLEKQGSDRRYKNLIGLTFGTGFGCGVVIDNVLLKGDNGCGGDVWLMNHLNRDGMIAEETVSLKGLMRKYESLSQSTVKGLTPKDLFDIAEGKREGDQKAAQESFYAYGEVAGDAIVHVLDIVDGIVVLGGGIANAAKYIMPGINKQLSRTFHVSTGNSFPCLQMQVFDLTNPLQEEAFYQDEPNFVKIPQTDVEIPYFGNRRSCVSVSQIGTSTAIALGAYAYALHQLDQKKQD